VSLVPLVINEEFISEEQIQKLYSDNPFRVIVFKNCQFNFPEESDENFRFKESVFENCTFLFARPYIEFYDCDFNGISSIRNTGNGDEYQVVFLLCKAEKTELLKVSSTSILFKKCSVKTEDVLFLDGNKVLIQKSVVKGKVRFDVYSELIVDESVFVDFSIAEASVTGLNPALSVNQTLINGEFVDIGATDLSGLAEINMKM